MDARELLLNQLESGRILLVRGTADLDEGEFHTQIAGGGESPNWILGHIAANEDFFLSKLLDTPLQVPASVHARYQLDESPPIDRGAALGRREILALFAEQRDRFVDALGRSDPSLWGEPAPMGLPPVFPTMGTVWGIAGTHQYWHIGQLMSIRSTLEKPPFPFEPL